MLHDSCYISFSFFRWRQRVTKKPSTHWLYGLNWCKETGESVMSLGSVVKLQRNVEEEKMGCNSGSWWWWGVARWSGASFRWWRDKRESGIERSEQSSTPGSKCACVVCVSFVKENVIFLENLFNYSHTHTRHLTLSNKFVVDFEIRPYNSLWGYSIVVVVRFHKKTNNE